MKKFLIFIIIVGLGASAYLTYDSHLKPLIAKITGSAGSLGEDTDRLVEGSDPDKQGKSKGKKPKNKGNAPKVTDNQPKTTQPEKMEPVKVEPQKSEIDLLVEAKYPMPNILPLMQIVDDWKNVPAKAYPRAVAIKQPLKFTMVIDGNEMASTAAPGTEVAPARIQGDILYVRSLANSTMQNQLPLDATDFKERVTQRYNEFVEYKKNQLATVRAKAKTALEANSDKLASMKANEGKWDQKGDPRFGPAKASLSGGNVSGVTLAEATTFRWNGSERVSGDFSGTFDTVTVHFEVSTIFGNFPTDYKCLMRGGQVVGWIDPVTDEKI